MQQQNTIPTATINAIANVQFGTAVVVTNAAAQASLSIRHAVSKCSPPRKPGGGSLERWRDEGLMRTRRNMPTPPRGGDVSVGGGVSYPMSVNVVMPPAVWATWVLGRSLCG